MVTHGSDQVRSLPGVAKLVFDASFKDGPPPSAVTELMQLKLHAARCTPFLCVGLVRSLGGVGGGALGAPSPSTGLCTSAWWMLLVGPSFLVFLELSFPSSSAQVCALIRQVDEAFQSHNLPIFHRVGPTG